MRARFDPRFVARAEAEGVQFISGVTVEALHCEKGRVCGVIADNETLRARYVVTAEGANSLLAERYGFAAAIAKQYGAGDKRNAGAGQTIA